MMKMALAGIIIILLAGSCGSLHIEKKHYSKGYYISWNKKIRGIDNFDPDKQITSKAEFNYTTSKLGSVSIPSASSFENYNEDSLISCTKTQIEATQKIESLTFSEHYLLQDQKITKANNVTPSEHTPKNVGLIILGFLVILIATAISIFVLLLGGEILGVLIALGIIPGIVLVYLGLKPKSEEKQSNMELQNRPINKWALATFILFFLCLGAAFIDPIVALLLFLTPVLLTFMIIAMIQFHRNPNKYRAHWLVQIPFYGLIATAVLYALLTLIVAFVY